METQVDDIMKALLRARLQVAFEEKAGAVKDRVIDLIEKEYPPSSDRSLLVEQVRKMPAVRAVIELSQVTDKFLTWSERDPNAGPVTLVFRRSIQ